MKKILLFLFGWFCFFSINAQTAVDFQVPDCSGNTYHFYSELDAGKVVVIGWTMPCGSCVLPLKTTYNVVQSYETTFPGKVQMLLADDYANTNCSSINLWANSNGLSNTIRFSSAAIKMADYGSNGMPKVVVVAGDNRRVYYNANDAVDYVALKEAIDQAISVITSQKENSLAPLDMLVVPNPARQETTVRLNLQKDAVVSLQVVDQEGKLVIKQKQYNIKAGFQEIKIDLRDLQAGVYQVHLIMNQQLLRQKLIIIQ